MWVEWNDNPALNNTRDCAIRAVGVALGVPWERAYAMLAANGFLMGDTMDSDIIWGAALRENGFRKRLAPDCPGCMTVREFCAEHPRGVYVLKTPQHVVAAVNGDYYDTFDSGGDGVLYYWEA